MHGRGRNAAAARPIFAADSAAVIDNAGIAARHEAQRGANRREAEFRCGPDLLCSALRSAGCAGAKRSTRHVDRLDSGRCQRDQPRIRRSPARRRKPAPRRAARRTTWWKDGGVTREKINAMCWMKYENGRKDMPVDKRADLVNDCVSRR